MRTGILSRYNSQVHMAHMCAIRVRGPSRPVACEAKKGKKGGKKGNKKGGSLLGDLANAPKIQPWQTTEVIMQHLLMIECYRFVWRVWEPGPLWHAQSMLASCNMACSHPATCHAQMQWDIETYDEAACCKISVSRM